jgi:hypothetical protein
MAEHVDADPVPAGAHADAHALDGGGVEPLLQGVLGKQQQGLAEVQGLGDELIAGGGEDGPGGGQVLDELHVAGRAEVEAAVAALSADAVDHHRRAQLAQGPLDARREVVLAVAEVHQQVVAPGRPLLLYDLAQHRADDAHARALRRGGVEAHHHRPVRSPGHEAAIDRRLHPAGDLVGRRHGPAAVGEHAVVVEADPRDLQPSGGVVRPDLRVGDDHVGGELLEDLAHHRPGRAADVEVQHVRHGLGERLEGRALAALAQGIPQHGDAADVVLAEQGLVGVAAGEDEHLVAGGQIRQDGQRPRRMPPAVAVDAVGDSQRHWALGIGHLRPLVVAGLAGCGPARHQM